MSDYLLYMVQEGGGCDYTIGCGIRVEHITADCYDEAYVWAMRILEDGGFFEKNSERQLKYCFLYKYESTDFNFQEIMNNVDKAKQEALLCEHDKKERKEYERLKAKFG